MTIQPKIWDMTLDINLVGKLHKVLNFSKFISIYAWVIIVHLSTSSRVNFASLLVMCQFPSVKVKMGPFGAKVREAAAL